MDRLQQKHSLFIKLGALFGPLLRLVEHPDQYDEQEKAEILARYFAEFPKLIQDFDAFRVGQPGHNYIIEHHRFYQSLDGIRRKVQHGTPLETIVREQLNAVQAAIDAVPVPHTSIILEAGSPFTAYCKLKELCEVDATKSLVWLDPYLGATIFHRYISSVRLAVPVTLVTSEPGPHAGNRDKKRWDEFMDVSRLYAKERGERIVRAVSLLYRFAYRSRKSHRVPVSICGRGSRSASCGCSAKPRRPTLSASCQYRADALRRPGSTPAY